MLRLATAINFRTSGRIFDAKTEYFYNLPNDVIQKSKVYADQEVKAKSLPKKIIRNQYRKLKPHETQILEDMYSAL